MDKRPKGVEYLKIKIGTLLPLLLAPRIPYLLVIAPDLLFWMLVIGGLGSKGYSTHSWFVDHTAYVAQHVGLSDRHQARRLLGEFFYADQPEDMGAGLWIKEVVASSIYSDGSDFGVQ
jgi:hypothetical protein